jgi:hypothetical protein
MVEADRSAHDSPPREVKSTAGGPSCGTHRVADPFGGRTQLTVVRSTRLAPVEPGVTSPPVTKGRSHSA